MSVEARRILVPVDGSPASEQAFRWACQLSKVTKAELHAIYVHEVPLELPLDSETAQDVEGEAVLNQAEAIADKEKCRLHAQLLQARHAGPAIVLEAEDRNMDLIVMGVPYQHKFGSSVLGQTATYVFKNASCQVGFWRERATALSTART